MATLRPLGVGSQILTHGDKMAGFYGEVNGIITADELRNMAGVTQGTAMQTGDITWLKFSHNYKTLYIAKQPIQHSISWDYLQSLDLVFGKMVEIGGSVYLLRLMQGSNVNPSSVSVLGVNNEWNKLIVFTSTLGDWNIYNNVELGTATSLNGWASWCVEVNSTTDTQRRIGRGGNEYVNVLNLPSNNVGIANGWRPVLELLY